MTPTTGCVQLASLKEDKFWRFIKHIYEQMKNVNGTQRHDNISETE